MLGIRFTRLGATVGVFAVVGVLAAAGGNARAATGAELSPATGEVKTTVDKSVSLSATASGAVTSNTMVTQVSWVGKGNLDVKVPIGTSSLRNLDGFSGVPGQGDEAVFHRVVDGAGDERIMSTANVEPIKVEVKTTLDGKAIKPEDIINKTGVLDVKYTIRNTTATTKPISYTDSAGNVSSTDLPSAVPFVGSLSITLPAGFNEITAPGVSGIAGNGHNGTLVDYSMVLYPPLGATKPQVGSSVVEVGYQSRIKDATLPPATFNFQPVKPYDSSTIVQTKDALVTESGDGAELVSKAAEMAGKLKALTGPKLLDQLRQGKTEIAGSLAKITDPTPGTGAIASAEEIAAGAVTLNKTVAGLMPQVQELATKVPVLQTTMKELSPLLVDMLQSTPCPNTGETAAACTHTLTASGCPTSVGTTVPGKQGSTWQMLQWVTLCLMYGQNTTGLQGGLYGELWGPAGFNVWGTFVGGCDATCLAVDGVSDAIAEVNQSVAAMLAFGNTYQAFGLAVAGTGADFGGPGSLAGYYLPAMGAELAATPAVSNLVNDSETLNNNFAQFLDATEPFIDQTAATVTALEPTVAQLQGVEKGFESAIVTGEKIHVDGESLMAAGPEAMTSTGEELVAQNGPPVAQLDAMQAESELGTGIPYGPAKGEHTTTTGTYQLTLAGASTEKKDNTIFWVFGILLLLVAGGIGTALWSKRRPDLRA